MKRKTNTFFTGINIAFESFSNMLDLTPSDIKHTNYSDDTKALKSDWKNIGKDIREAMDDFTSK